MSIDTTPSTVATNALQALPFDTLIGGPLDAAINAQAMAAKTSWEFIQEVGLNTDEKGKKEAVNVTFFYNKNGQMTKLIVPILTIVPIPYIAIDDMNIKFTANISAASSSIEETSSSSETQMGGEAEARLKIGPFGVKAKFKANYSSKKDSKASQESKYSVEYTMDVAVHAGQSDMPAGLATVLNILQSSITDARADGTFIFSPTSAIVDFNQEDDLKLVLNVVIKDSDGLLVKDQDVELSAQSDGDKLGLSAPKEAKTNSEGKVVFELTPAATLESGVYNLDFKVKDDAVLQATLELALDVIPKTTE